MRVAANKAKGARFESLFVCRAAASGMCALRNELTFRFLPGGKMRPIRADLDYRVLTKEGRVAFIDCKEVATKYFLISRIDRAQLQRAVHYASWRVPSGFVVHFSLHRQVVFFSAASLALSSQGARFYPCSGVDLGGSVSFLLAKIFHEA